jgi:biopolymer transport protein ExbB
MFEIFKDGLDLFISGGEIMYMLGVVALILYGFCFAALAYVSRGNLNEKDADKWEEWIAQPEKAEGRLGEAIVYVLHGPKLSIKTVDRRFNEIRLNLVSSIDRRLLVINTLVAAAPLGGLLGTVTGMLAMFTGLSQGTGPGGMQRVADGMQEALITTQTGLTIALPGLFLGLIIKSKRDRIAGTLVRLESFILSSRFKRCLLYTSPSPRDH